MSDAIQRVHAEIAQHLSEIATLFKPGVKLTLLVRTTSHPDGRRDMVSSDDDLVAAIAALRIRLTDEERARLATPAPDATEAPVDGE